MMSKDNKHQERMVFEQLFPNAKGFWNPDNGHGHGFYTKSPFDAYWQGWIQRALEHQCLYYELAGATPIPKLPDYQLQASLKREINKIYNGLEDASKAKDVASSKWLADFRYWLRRKT